MFENFIIKKDNFISLCLYLRTEHISRSKRMKFSKPAQSLQTSHNFKWRMHTQAKNSEETLYTVTANSAQADGLYHCC
jgi:hypothetical protein